MSTPNRGADGVRSARQPGVQRHVHLVVFALILAGAVALGLVVDQLHRASVYRNLASELDGATRLRGANLENAIATLREDTLLLSRTPPVRGILRADRQGGGDPVEHYPREVWIKRLKEIFAVFLETRPDYTQARYIGVAEDGRELVRVDRRQGKVVVIPDAELQQKGRRDYFRDGLRLREGEVYLSEFNLNREHGDFEMPHVPTVRALTPVYDPDGHLFGMIVVNMAVRPLFAQLAHVPLAGAAVYVSDERGRYLLHPDPAMAFSFELGNRHRLAADFPELAGMLDGARPGDDVYPTRRMRLGGRDCLVAAQRLHVDSGRPGRFLLLVLAVPEDSLSAGIDAFRLRAALATLLVLFLVLPAVSLLIRRILAPLDQLCLAAQSISRGQYDVALPETHHREVSALVAGFEHMREQVALREDQLRRHNARLAEQISKGAFDLLLAGSVVDNTSEGVMVTDSQARILSVNRAFTEITGYGAEEAVGATPRLLRSDYQDAEFYRAMWQQLLGDGRWQGELWNRRKNGEAFLEWLTINRVAGAHAGAERYIAVFTDVTEQRRKDERIQFLAFHDPLTGLPNRALVQDRLQHAIELARRQHGRAGVMMIDLDRFKAVNDGIGHDVGDQLLKVVAERLTGSLRRTDTVGRMGGDEFLVVLEDGAAPEMYAEVAEGLIRTISEPAVIQAHHIEVGASVGIAFYPDDGGDVATLLKQADVAMYAAKADGKGVCRFFSADMTERASRFLAMEMELRQALARDELELHYQPKMSLADGRLHGVEALVRWRHPTRGLLMPADFIPVAEDSGIIVALGDWVLTEACRQAAVWQGRMGTIAVNVSGRQMERVDLVARIGELTARYGIPPAYLQIELTESMIMGDPERAAGLLGKLRELGITVAIDDFGTGYSSLSYLRRLPIDVLKIDRSFVLGTGTDQEVTEIARTVVALGQALRMAVVAEGIEAEAQATLLRDMGCDLGQGYLYAEPLAAAALEAWLAAGRGAG
ncbi:EAL domain-containing protein [Parasulfuritortus cantonensis]|uniref:EAL domain-containing protein n=1 Tax=Parasulfuritortus cantonensis TaxID=2528202 RepID=A0A4R1B9D0_9PROT|nr:EAL domain-containing protein [Parasulfuritortus cantonensis]TCJ13510.1 EAL domain-containing protein [Parasulfuritortus cantonensis]